MKKATLLFGIIGLGLFLIWEWHKIGATELSFFEQRMAKIEGRAEFELNMLKSPLTGRIPENIKDQEREFLANAPVKKRKVLPQATLRGPDNKGGRVRAIAFDNSDVQSQTLLAGGASSGVFRTTNRGQSWTRVSPDDAIHNVTTIVQDRHTPSIWYYGTGELWSSASMASNSFFGDGIWKSVDNGLSWNQLASTASNNVNTFDSYFDLVHRLAVNPLNGDIYAAIHQKIMRSQNGGNTWTELFETTSAAGLAGITDVLISPGGSHFFAAFAGTAPNNLGGVWYSQTGNSGDWTKIAGVGSSQNPTEWAAADSYGRIVLGWSDANQSLLVFYDNGYVNTCSGAQEKPEGDVFRYALESSTWEKLNLNEEGTCRVGVYPLAVQGGYNMAIAASPVNPDLIVLGGTSMYRTMDSFTTDMERIGGYATSDDYNFFLGHHCDQHVFVFDPKDPEKIIVGSDGGIHETKVSDSVPKWTSLNNDFVTYQFYHVAISPFEGSDLVMGGSQDNGTSLSFSGAEHEDVLGADGVSVGIGGDPNDEMLFFGIQYGGIYKRSLRNPSASVVSIKPSQVADVNGLFVTYFLTDPDNPDNLYYANESRLFRVTDSRNATSGGWTELTGLSGIIGNANIFSMAVTRGLYTSDSKLFLGTDNGKLVVWSNPANMSPSTAPQNISPPNAPAGTISSISVDPSDDQTVMITFSNYDLPGSIHLSRDGGSSWQDIEGNMALPSIRSSAIVNRNGAQEFFVGTSIGLWSTANPAGSSTVWQWESILDMKSPVVASLSFRPVDNQLLIGTHGNGMYQVDLNQEVALFSSKSNLLQIPYATTSNGFDTILHVINQDTSHTNNLDVFVYQADGQYKGAVSESRQMVAGEKLSWHLSEQFASSSTPFWLQIGSDLPVIAYVELLDSRSNSAYYANNLEKQVYLPHIAKSVTQFETLLSVVNGSQQAANPTLTRKPQGDVFSLAQAHDPLTLYSGPITNLLGSDLASGPDIWGVVQNDSPQIAAMEQFSRLPGRTQQASLGLTNQSGKTLRFLHVAVDTGQFWTGMVYINVGAGSAQITETYYDTSGMILKTETPSLAAGEKRTLLYDFANQVQVPAGTAWIEVQANQDLIGYELFGSPSISTNDNFVGLQGSYQGYQRLVFPHFISTSSMYTGVVFLNVGDQTGSLTVTAYGFNGQLLQTVTLPDVAAKTKVVRLLSGLFSSETRANAGWLNVVASASSFAGFQIWGDHNVSPRDFLAGLHAAGIAP